MNNFEFFRIWNLNNFKRGNNNEFDRKLCHKFNSKIGGIIFENPTQKWCTPEVFFFFWEILFKMRHNYFDPYLPNYFDFERNHAWVMCSGTYCLLYCRGNYDAFHVFRKKVLKEEKQIYLPWATSWGLLLFIVGIWRVDHKIKMVSARRKNID
jgi:hypothetical protein